MAFNFKKITNIIITPIFCFFIFISNFSYCKTLNYTNCPAIKVNKNSCIFNGNNNNAWHIGVPGISTKFVIENGVIKISKSGGKKYWNGIESKKINIQKIRGLTISLSFDLKLLKIKTYGSKSYHFFVPSIDFYKNNNKKNFARKDLIIKKAFSNWKRYNISVKVPKYADSIKIKFKFGCATGIAKVRNVCVSCSDIKLNFKKSLSFSKILPIQLKNSKLATESFISILNKKGQLIAQNYITFDLKGIYFNVRINDNYFYQTYSKGAIWKGDSLQMAFDPKYTRSSLKTDDDDYELGFAYVGHLPYIHPYIIPLETIFESFKVKFKFIHKDNKSIYDVFIPWGVIYLNYKNINKIGYDFLVNNNDGKGRVFYGWQGAIAGAKNPFNYGTLFFDKDKKFICAEVYLKNNKKEFYDNDYINGEIVISCLEKRERKTNFKIILNNNPISDISGQVTFNKGENTLFFSYPSDLMKSGKNILHVKVKDLFYRNNLINKKFILYRLSENKLKSKIDEILQKIKYKISEVNSKLKKYDNGLYKPREIIASKGLVEFYLPAVKADIKAKRFTLALKESKELLTIIKKAEKELNDRSFILSKEKNVIPLYIKKGIFYNNQGEATFPFGFWNNPLSESYIAVLKDMGMTVTNVFWPDPSNFFSDVNLKTKKSGFRILKLIANKVKIFAQNNIICVTQPSVGGAPSFFKKSYPNALIKGNHFFPFDPDHYAVKKLLNKYYEIFFKFISKENLFKYFLSFCVQGEPAFSSISPKTVFKFVQHLKNKYKNIETLNKYWKTNFPNFENIKYPQIYFNKRKIAYYDWCVFNNERFSVYFSNFAKVVKTCAKGKKYNIHARIPNGIIWNDKFGYNTGHDREKLMTITTVNGCDTRIYPIDNKDFSFWWQNQSMSFDFQKSLAPEQPIYDGEWHSIQTIGHNHNNVSPEYLRCALRMAVWHGLAACRIWGFIHKRDSGGVGGFFSGHPHTQPLPMEAFCRESIIIGNEMDKVVPFQNNLRPVCFLYSLPSAIYDGTDYLSVLKKLYRAFYFNDLSLGFVTEKMVIKNRLPVGIKLLVIPNCRYGNIEFIKHLKKLPQHGVNLLFVGNENFTKNNFDMKYMSSKITPKYIWPILEDWKKYLHLIPRLFKKLKYKPRYKLLLSNNLQYKFIEARFVKKNNDVLGYAINIGKKPASFYLQNNDRKTVRFKINGKSNLFNKYRLKEYEYIEFKIIDK